MPLAVLIGLVALPVVLLFLLRVNAAFVFLSLCLGSILVRFAGDDAVSIVGGASNSSYATASTIQLALLIAPAFLTVIFMMGTVSDKKKILNILPAAVTGLLLALLAVPLLSPGLSFNITQLDAWQQATDAQSGVIAISTLVCLIFLWASRPKHDDKHKKRKH
jgi:xanthine/uracil permease